jgi:hypothetical protein
MLLLSVTLLHADPARPFDFIIDGELLRKSLQQHLLEHDLSPVSTQQSESNVILRLATAICDAHSKLLLVVCHSIILIVIHQEVTRFGLCPVHTQHYSMPQSPLAYTMQSQHPASSIRPAAFGQQRLISSV